MDNKRKYITGIDGLRSIAVVGVILYHLTPRIMPGGFLGVTLFFVISGYLMTDIILSEWNRRKKISLKQFYYKRAKRIYPSLIVMFVVSGSAFLLLSKDLLINFKQIVSSSLLNVNNFWQMLNGSSYFDRFGNESAFTHLWSLSIEGQFYIIWPILVAFLLYKQEDYKRLKTFVLVSGGLSSVLMIAFYNPNALDRIYYGTDTRIFPILIGAYLAIYLKEHGERLANISRNWQLTALVTSVISMILCFIFISDNQSFVYQGGMLLFSLISMVLLGTIITSETSNSLLTNPIFKWIGTRSYEIYLWQFPVMITYEKIIKWDGTNSFYHLLIQIILILGLSELTYRLVKYLVSHVKFSKEWLQETVQTHKGKVSVAVCLLFAGTFITSLAIAPGGRSSASVELEEKLKKNQEIIANKETTPSTTDSKTKESSTKESTTTSSSSEADVKKEEAANQLVELSTKEKDYLKGINLSAIGDSLLLSAAPEVKEIFPKSTIDAEVGRQLMDSEPIFKKASDDKKLGDVVLVVLGTNGSFTTKEMEDILAYMPDKEIFFVNTMVQRPWQKAVNDELVKTEKNHKNTHVIDWKTHSDGHRDWFDVDDVHLTPDGAQQFSAYIGKEIYNQLNK